MTSLYVRPLPRESLDISQPPSDQVTGDLTAFNLRSSSRMSGRIYQLLTVSKSVNPAARGLHEALVLDPFEVPEDLQDWPPRTGQSSPKF